MPREKGIDEIEVHVATLCFEEQDGALRVLVAKRTGSRKIHPGLWECGGGQVRKGQTFQDAVKTQARDEFGLEIDVLFSANDYKIETEGKVIPGIRFVCRPKPGQTVKLDPAEHTEFRWVAPDDLSSLPAIPGLAEEVRQAVVLYKKLTQP